MVPLLLNVIPLGSSSSEFTLKLSTNVGSAKALEKNKTWLINTMQKKFKTFLRFYTSTQFKVWWHQYNVQVYLNFNFNLLTVERNGRESGIKAMLQKNGKISEYDQKI